MLFLELFTSMVINVALVEEPSGAKQFFSVLILACIAGLIGFLLFLLAFGCGIGPSTEHLYERWTVTSSFFVVRPLRNK